jgi:hypothetical protein
MSKYLNNLFYISGRTCAPSALVLCSRPVCSQPSLVYVFSEEASIGMCPQPV